MLCVRGSKQNDKHGQPTSFYDFSCIQTRHDSSLSVCLSKYIMLCRILAELGKTGRIFGNIYYFIYYSITAESAYSYQVYKQQIFCYSRIKLNCLCLCFFIFLSLLQQTSPLVDNILCSFGVYYRRALLYVPGGPKNKSS